MLVQFLHKPVIVVLKQVQEGALQCYNKFMMKLYCVITGVTKECYYVKAIITGYCVIADLQRRRTVF